MNNSVLATRRGLADAAQIILTVLGVLAWFAVYWQLEWFSDWLVARLPMAQSGHLHEALAFFLYDTPKVLMLLALVVFRMGMVRSFFSAERTRALLAGRREGLGNVASASLGKGAALGTVLAFMMAVTALSAPETIILRKVLSLRLIGVVTLGIVMVGFPFNALFA